MILYAYWFSEFGTTLAERIVLYRLKKRGVSIKEEELKQGDGKLFFLFIYWVFIVVVAGFITAPESAYVENIRVLLFHNTSFNLNLLITGMATGYFYIHLLYLSKEHPNVDAVSKSYATMGKRTLVMHVSIILGTFVWFAMNKDSFFFNIDVGEYGAHGFMLVFVFIKLSGDLIGLKESS